MRPKPSGRFILREITGQEAGRRPAARILNLPAVGLGRRELEASQMISAPGSELTVQAPLDCLTYKSASFGYRLRSSRVSFHGSRPEWGAFFHPAFDSGGLTG